MTTWIVILETRNKSNNEAHNNTHLRHTIRHTFRFFYHSLLHTFFYHSLLHTTHTLYYTIRLIYQATTTYSAKYNNLTGTRAHALYSRSLLPL